MLGSTPLPPPPRHGREGTPHAGPRPFPHGGHGGGGGLGNGPPCPPPPPTPWCNVLLAPPLSHPPEVSVPVRIIGPHPLGGGAQGAEAATSAAQVELDLPSP